MIIVVIAIFVIIAFLDYCIVVGGAKLERMHESHNHPVEDPDQAQPESDSTPETHKML